MPMTKCKHCSHEIGASTREIEAKSAEATRKGQASLFKGPRRQRQFEAAKIVEREFHQMSGKDAQRAKSEFLRIMRQMQDNQLK